ncbi:probable inactive shikimate kinase like 1, chloroplastic isoform X2 [Amborella trichopoda]|uniref:probable inactive shikimate kinase like 1, chloroplastic isoform X2 n=1 Tax=Amborella trichopoda TaxID=13333 RepID=UPI0009BE554A|nr:probable inactive shikimate kinase like 1, chloroplastic isoform X2 [Amborella trichopoda]|eukprot:XP_011623429.2 probable inactive shikimate kinase like 1, chloroplastic isoform X2 [Amborella trichopoda]
MPFSELMDLLLLPFTCKNPRTDPFSSLLNPKITDSSWHKNPRITPSYSSFLTVKNDSSFRFFNEKPYQRPELHIFCPIRAPSALRNRRFVSEFSKNGDLSGSRSSVADNLQTLALKNKAVEVNYELKGTSIFLVGMNGSVKTNLAKLLAEVLRYYHFDSDNLVEQAAGGEAAAKSFREEDEEGFRNSETEVLKQLSAMGRLVVSAGDGAVQSSTNLAFLRYGISIWIDVPLTTLAKEIVETGNRCPLTWGISASDSYSEVLTKLTQIYEEMKGGYETADAKVSTLSTFFPQYTDSSSAHLQVHTRTRNIMALTKGPPLSLPEIASQLGYDEVDAITPEDVAIEVLKEIEGLMRVKKMMEDAAKPF